MVDPTGTKSIALAADVFAGGAYRPFAELSAADADALAAELGPAREFGHGRQVEAVALAWLELAALMHKRGAAEGRRPRRRVGAALRRAPLDVPPGGSLLP